MLMILFMSMSFNLIIQSFLSELGSSTNYTRRCQRDNQNPQSKDRQHSGPKKGKQYE